VEAHTAITAFENIEGVLTICKSIKSTRPLVSRFRMSCRGGGGSHFLDGIQLPVIPCRFTAQYLRTFVDAFGMQKQQVHLDRVQRGLDDDYDADDDKDQGEEEEQVEGQATPLADDVLAVSIAVPQMASADFGQAPTITEPTADGASFKAIVYNYDSTTIRRPFEPGAPETRKGMGQAGIIGAPGDVGREILTIFVQVLLMCIDLSKPSTVSIVSLF